MDLLFFLDCVYFSLCFTVKYNTFLLFPIRYVISIVMILLNVDDEINPFLRPQSSCQDFVFVASLTDAD